MEVNLNTTDSARQSKNIAYIDKSIIKRTGLLIAVIWTVLVFSGAGWQLFDGYKNTLESIRIQASDSFEKDLVYRRWAAEHGGVYVPPTKETPPNPYLSHIKNRDITTHSGMELTLVNPAYMTRQVHELGRKQYGLQGHITSLTPLRPENVPDAWEKEALQAFERGEAEVFELTTIGDKDFLRLMRPMITEVPCLKCHAKQGYEEGDIRGGISISVPMANQFKLMYRHIAIVTITYILVWLIGLGGVWFSSVRIGRYIRERNRSINALHASEVRFRALFDNAPLGYQSLDMNGDITEINETWCKLLGYTKEEVLGKSFSQFLHPDYKEIFKVNFPKFKGMGYTQGVEFEMIKKDGSMVIIIFNGRIGHNDDGSFKQTHCVLTDITEQKKSENISKSVAKLNESIINSSPLGIAIYNSDGNCVIANTAAARVIGGTKAQMLKQNYHQLDSWKESGLYDVVLCSIQENANKEHEIYVETTFGKVCALYIRLVPITFDDELHLLAMFEDITELKLAEKESARFGRILEDSLNEIYLFDADTLKFTQVNRAAKRNIGYTMEELQKLTALDIKPDLTPESFIELVAPLHNGEKEIIVFETVYERKDQSLYDVEVHLQLSKFEHKKLFVAIIWDITARKQLEQQLYQAQKMESIGRLAGGVAHDYNNALSVIIGFTELTMDDVEPDGPIHDNLSEILNASNRAADITRQLLAFSRKQTISPKLIDLNETIKNMLKMIRRLIGEDINLAWLPGGNILPVMMDLSQVDQILANLCVNARDAIEGVGKITIETKKVIFDEGYCADHSGFTPGKFVMLAVSDNGCGIEKEILGNIFEPFFTTKDVDKGTGLGLATVYGIIKQNCGFINVYSETDKGTTIKLYLPMYDDKIVTSQEERPIESPSGHGELVLLVEDDPPLLLLSERILRALNYTVLSADTPSKALDLAKEHSSKIHLLVSDVIMPEMNGRELEQQIQFICPDIKSLFMSGYTANVIAHHGVLDKGLHFIQKPFSKSDLAIIIRKLLDEDKGAA